MTLEKKEPVEASQEQQKEPADLLLKRAVNKFNVLYAGIFGEISSMLKKSKLLPMADLQEQNPKFTKIVEELSNFRDFCKIGTELLKIDRQKELDELDVYIGLAANLAKAIDTDDYDALCAAIAALDEKPYI